MPRFDCLCILLLAGWLALSPAANATSYAGVQSVEQKIDLRALPSLLVEWRWVGSVDEWRLEDGVGYVVGGDRLSAIDLETGEALWDHDLELDCACSKLEVAPTRIVAGIDGRAILIDRASGALVADVALGKSITALLPEPLVLAYEDLLGTHGLVLLDESSGVEVARYLPPGGISNVERVGQWLIVTEAAGSGSRVTLTGLDLSLLELWRRQLPEQSMLRRKGDDLVVESWAGMQRTRQTLDPATGELLAQGNESGTDDGAEGIEIRVLAGGLALVLENGAPPILIKPRRKGRGDPWWQVELPVVVNESAEWGERVVLAQEAWGVRSAVLIVDTRDGEIETLAAGLRGMNELHTFGDLLVSRTASGLAAVRLDSFGPSDAASTSVEEAVAGILLELDDPEASISPYSMRQELEGLGAAALPYLSDAIPGVRAEVLAMVAALLSDSGYGPAATPLAARVLAAMDEPKPESEEETWARRSHLGQLGTALATISGAEQAPVLDQLLEFEAVDGYAKLALMAALGRVAPQRATAALARLRDGYGPPEAWWVPPAADSWLELAAMEVDPTSFEDLWTKGMAEEAQTLAKAAGTAIAEGDGVRWILFPDSRLGATDLWTAPLADDGSVGEAVFVGSIPPVVANEETFVLPVLQASLRDRVLEIGNAGADTLAVALDELLLDSDGDGLTDRLEASLSLDPQAADSDGDGLPDPVDLAPHGRGDREPTDQEAALLALHEVLGLIGLAEVDAFTTDAEGDPGTEGLSLYLTEVPALDWRAGPAATFVLDEPDGTCRTRSYRLAETPPRPLGADELAIEVIVACQEYADSEFAQVFVMRSTPGGWVLSGLGW